MKKKDDPRHQQRKIAAEMLFAQEFAKQDVKNEIATSVNRQKKAIDALIAKSAPAWPISQIATIDLAILRLAVWELLFAKKEPYKVIVDEAVEIAKEYGGESSASFINGVLGTIIKSGKKQLK